MIDAPSTNVTSAVLDASALIAFLHAEPGGNLVRDVIRESIISTVNYSEVLKKALERGGQTAAVAQLVKGFSVGIVPFDEMLAEAAAELYPQAKAHGMSFADRACLALAVARGLCVLTTDRKMALLKLPVKVKLIRNAH